MLTADEILEEVRAYRRDLKTLFAAGDNDDDDKMAARKHEDEAKRHEEDAARHRTAARKAREEDDDEDAKRHEEDAKKARMDAATCRAAAKAAYAAAAKSLAASDEIAAKRHEADAARLHKEEEDAARRDADEDEDAKRYEADAAATKQGQTSNILPMFAMFLRAVTNDGDNMDAMKDASNLALLKHLMGMVYPAYAKRSTRSQAAAQDDTAEDTALFKRLIKQSKDSGDLHASGVTDLRLERKLRSMEAAMGEMFKLLTDVVHSKRDLATDGAQGGHDLLTDRNHGNNGGPTRRTMSATGGVWQGKFDEQQDSTQQSMKEIDAALDEESLDPVQRMATKLVLGWQGKVKA